MSLHYDRDDAARCIRLTAVGEVTMEEWRRAISRQVAEDCWAYGVLYDSLARTNLHSPAEIQESLALVEDLIRQHGPRGPVAYVARDLAAYSSSRTYGVLAERLSFAYATFTNADEARSWLTAQLAGKERGAAP